TPNTDCFPSEAEWKSLNTSLHGALIAAVPPASVCYPSSPFHDFNETLCAFVASQWLNSSFHAANPISIDYPIWANNSCNPIFANGSSITGDPGAEAEGCSLGAGGGGRGIGGGYPYYVVNASSAEQISTALKWAGKTGVRVVIKNTGHNFPGRSTGWGSLSIWTHNLKSFQLHKSWKPSDCPSDTPAQMAATVSAGMQDFEVYALSNKSGAIVVGGSNPTVGLAGWMQGGGHGPLSSSYGMGSDNLLEATVVLASGEIVTANAFQHQDLYWALRGGGGGTFGVITQAVVKAFPTPKSNVFILNIAQTKVNPNTTTAFYDLMAQLHHEFIAWKTAGLQGYYGIVGPPASPGLYFMGGWYFYDKPASFANDTFASFKKTLDQTVAEGWLFYNTTILEAPTFYDMWYPPGPEPVATGGSDFGSRLLSTSSLSEDLDLVARTLQYVGPKTDGSSPVRNNFVIGHMIANSANRNLDTALNPAWRDAVVHLITTEGWVDGSPESEINDVYNDITYNRTRALRQLAPDSGAYFNEPDVFEPDWQYTFFGKNYPKLRDIKKKYDPNGLFWCRSCVGSEDWVEQSDGKLCQVPWTEDGCSRGRKYEL
ncbi:FAD binding domain-containing protein, partial [Rhizodiscina lignyota]